MCSGVKNEVTADHMQDDPAADGKIYFYRDKAMKHLVAYFIREQVAGIILGPDNVNVISRYARFK